MQIYQKLLKKHQSDMYLLKRDFNFISISRLISILFFLVFIYLFFKTEKINFVYCAIFSISVFILLIRFHNKISLKKDLKEALININSDEIDFLNKKKNHFDNGIEFVGVNHSYAHDLDIFGNHSLFQNLNRTYTFIGKKKMSNALLNILPNQQIIDNQEAIRELSPKIEWRQDFMSIAKVSKDKKIIYDNLIAWSKFNSKPLEKIDILFSYILPFIFWVLVFVYVYTKNDVFFNYISIVFIANLSFAARFLNRIKLENSNSTNVDKAVKQYGFLIEQIENHSFKTKKILDLQLNLKSENDKASQSLNQLSNLFAKLDSVGNLLMTVLLNGTILYHVHNLKDIIKWKEKNANNLEKWLEIIGEFEMLNSLANFSFNNQEFTYPELNDKSEIKFEKLSHPLIDSKTRIGNDVSFINQSFIILTGSNMSGKSTFLRSLGINMVLAGIGAPICASRANINPMPILVSMRLSDSLSDSESYFYAEIKRLKQIMETLENQQSFVLLDEILRGTNSDDKRSGTIAVVKKMISKNAIGAIATHDIEVCLTTNEYPNLLINKCFEVAIINDDLHFDYKLQDGICKNKSATFLMTKIGVI